MTQSRTRARCTIARRQPKPERERFVVRAVRGGRRNRTNRATASASPCRYRRNNAWQRFSDDRDGRRGSFSCGSCSEWRRVRNTTPAQRTGKLNSLRQVVQPFRGPGSDLHRCPVSLETAGGDVNRAAPCGGDTQPASCFVRKMRACPSDNPAARRSGHSRVSRRTAVPGSRTSSHAPGSARDGLRLGQIHDARAPRPGRARPRAPRAGRHAASRTPCCPTGHRPPRLAIGHDHGQRTRVERLPGFR